MARKKIYKTNKGKMIDMEAMRTANEQTIASGNMGVNAKGDQVKGGNVVKTAKERVTPYYAAKKQVARTSIKPPIKKKDAQINTQPEPEPKAAPSKEPIDILDIISEEHVATDQAAVEEILDTPGAKSVIKVRERDDGSTYKEIMFPDGSMEVEELKAAPTKKKAKKKASKKKK